MMRRVLVQRWPAVPTEPNHDSRHCNVHVCEFIHNDGVVAAEFE